MLPFIRSDLAQLVSYTPHPGGDAGRPAEGIASIIDRLDTNESPFDLPEDLKQKLGWSVQQELESNRYPDGGHAALKRAIAQYATESASLPAAIVPDQISVSSGSDELIRSLLIATCLGGEGGILVADPTFSMYAITARTLGVPVVSVGRSEVTFETNLQAAQAALEAPTSPPIRAVFVVHPNSPTGNSLTAAEINWLRQLPQQILAVIDEAYFEFSGKTLLAELPQHPNWVILRTFSKAFRLAAYRVGYAIAHPELAATLEKIRLPYNLPSVSQTAAALTLAHRQELLTAIPLILKERDRLLTTLSQLSAWHIWPSTANFLFMRLKSGSDADLERCFTALRRQGTLVRKTCGGLRVTVGTPEENERTLARLTQMSM